MNFANTNDCTLRIFTTWPNVISLAARRASIVFTERVLLLGR